MSSRNDNNAGGALAALGMGVIILGIVIYAIACFIALVFSLLGLAALALRRPIPLWGGETLTPREGAIFLMSGVAGAIGVPVFALLCGWLLEFRIEPGWWFYLVTGGYAVVSIAVLAFLDENAPETLRPENFRVIEHVPPPPPPAIPKPAEPFRFADWNDGELRR